jgi:4-amino-4-deoxy-L-arabinose transferase-like glycosyltransferase
MSLLPSQPDGAECAPASLRPGWAGRIPWDGLAVVAASLLFLSLFYRFPISDPDEGIIATGAERILRGEVPFRDFFSELGPGSFYLQAAIFRIVGESLSTVRLTAWILGGILSGLVYLLAKRLIPGPGALVPAVVFAMICYPYAYRISHHWWGNFFLLVSVLCLTEHAGRVLGTGDAGEKALLVTAGAFAALSLLTMQSKGVWALIMGAAYLFLAGKVARGESWLRTIRDGWRPNFWFLSAGAAVLILPAVYFLAHGALDAWVDDNFLFLFTNYRPYLDVPQADPWSIIRHLTRLVHQEPSVHLVLYLPGYIFFFLAGPAVAFGGAAWRLRSEQRLDPLCRRVILLFLLQGIGGFVSEYHSADFFHLVSAAPLMLILLTYEWSRALRAERRVVRWLAAAGAVFALLLTVFTGSRKALNAVRIDTAVETRRGVLYVAPEAAQETRQIIAAIQNAVPAGGETFVFPYHAEMYFLTATRNPTRYDVLLPEFHSRQQIEETIASLRARRPARIFSFDRMQRWTIRPHFPDDPPDVHGPHPVEKTLMAPGSGYEKVADVAGMEVWARQP